MKIFNLVSRLFAVLSLLLLMQASVYAGKCIDDPGFDLYGNEQTGKPYFLVALGTTVQHSYTETIHPDSSYLKVTDMNEFGPPMHWDPNKALLDFVWDKPSQWANGVPDSAHSGYVLQLDDGGYHVERENLSRKQHPRVYGDDQHGASVQNVVFSDVIYKMFAFFELHTNPGTPPDSIYQQIGWIKIRCGQDVMGGDGKLRLQGFSSGTISNAFQYPQSLSYDRGTFSEDPLWNPMVERIFRERANNPNPPPVTPNPPPVTPNPPPVTPNPPPVTPNPPPVTPNPPPVTPIIPTTPTTLSGQVITEPILSVEENFIDFGTIDKGESAVQTFNLSNSGVGILEIKDVKSFSGNITIDPRIVEGDNATWVHLPRYNLVKLRLTLQENTGGAILDTLYIVSNDRLKANSVYTVPVQGEFLGSQPVLRVSPLSWELSRLNNKEFEHSFVITNSGSTPLEISNFNMDIQGIDYTASFLPLSLTISPGDSADVSTTLVFLGDPPGSGSGSLYFSWNEKDILEYDISYSINMIFADFNYDGKVDVDDFLLFVPAFGSSQPENSRFDLDNDGIVGVGDFLLFVSNFGTGVE